MPLEPCLSPGSYRLEKYAIHASGKVVLENLLKVTFVKQRRPRRGSLRFWLERIAGAATSAGILNENAALDEFENVPVRRVLRAFGQR